MSMTQFMSTASYPLKNLFKYTSEYVPYTDTTPIKSIDDNDMDQLI